MSVERRKETMIAPQPLSQEELDALRARLEKRPRFAPTARESWPGFPGFVLVAATGEPGSSRYLIGFYAPSARYYALYETEDDRLERDTCPIPFPLLGTALAYCYWHNNNGQWPEAWFVAWFIADDQTDAYHLYQEQGGRDAVAIEGLKGQHPLGLE